MVLTVPTVPTAAGRSVVTAVVTARTATFSVDTCLQTPRQAAPLFPFSIIATICISFVARLSQVAERISKLRLPPRLGLGGQGGEDGGSGGGGGGSGAGGDSGSGGRAEALKRDLLEFARDRWGEEAPVHLQRGSAIVTWGRPASCRDERDELLISSLGLDDTMPAQ